jgi:hypothetical protein
MLELLKIMSDNEHDDPLIRNEDTLRRRAWIDRALASVRGRLKPAELGETPTATEAVLPEPAEDGRRPQLYLVRNTDSR